MNSGIQHLRNRGFTIIELMVTVSITSVLVLGAVGSHRTWNDDIGKEPVRLELHGAQKQ